MGSSKLSIMYFSDKLIESLNDNELEAVAAHEFGHVITKDSLFGTLLILVDYYTLGVGLFMIFHSFAGLLSLLIAMLLHVAVSASFGGSVSVLLAGIAVACYYFAAKIIFIIFHCSHQMSADKLAAIIMGEPRSLISALQKISESESSIKQRCDELKKFESKFC